MQGNVSAVAAGGRSMTRAWPAWPALVVACLGAWFLAATLLLHASDAKGAGRYGADYFPNVELQTQDGRKVRFYDDLLKGKSVAINVVYTGCGNECPLETARLVQLQRLLGERVGRDVHFYSISIDPLQDTPEALKAYADKFGVGPGWTFLTGKPDDIELVVRKLGLSRLSDAATKDGHAPSLMLGNEPGGQWMRNSAVDNPRFLAATMKSFFGWTEALPQPNYADARPLQAQNGQLLFQTRCSACHSIGGGDGLAPDLLGVTARRDRAWLERYVLAPDRLLAEKDPIATELFERYRKVRMPNLRMGTEDVAAVLAYLEARRAAALRPVTASAK